MAITNLDGLVNGMASSKVYPIAKASIANAVAGTHSSLWRGTGFPAQGAVPTTAAICTNSTTGAFPLPVRTTGQDRVISKLDIAMATVGNAFIIEDRLMHMGGLNGTLTTAQTVGIDLNANLANNNLAERIGSGDYSEVQWFLEWYTDTGATSVTPTAQCTFHDGTTGSVNIDNLGVTTILATTRASRRYRLNPTNGKYIRSVETVTLSATTGTAGNFGVTATRPLTAVPCIIANVYNIVDWSMLGLPKVFDQSCIAFSQLCATTLTGATQGNLQISVA